MPVPGRFGAGSNSRLPDHRTMPLVEPDLLGRCIGSVGQGQSRCREWHAVEAGRAIEASNDGLVVTDPVGQFIYINRSHPEMFGFSGPKEPIGLHRSTLYGDAARISRSHRLSDPDRQGPMAR